MDSRESADARDRKAEAAEPGRRRRPRRGRRILGLAVYIAILVEIAAFVAFWVRDRASFSYARIADEQARVLGRAMAGEEAAVPDQRDHVVHPFIGWVRDVDARSGRDPALYPPDLTRFGFRDDPLRKRDPRKLIVALLGGSVAVMLGEAAGDVLASELARAPAFAGREVVLVRLGVAAGKQPQQAMILGWFLALGGEFDIVVNLDGFNEVALPPDNLASGMYPWFPVGWWAAAGRLGTPEGIKTAAEAMRLGDTRRQWAALFHDSWLRWSVAAGFVWSTRDRMLAAAAERAGGAGMAPGHLPYQARGPGTEGYTPDNILAESMEVWERCSRLLHDLCRARGIQYHHFLQPNQYFTGSKTLGDEEKRTAFLENHPWKPRVEAAYPGLVERGRRLAAGGVAFTDLTMVFHGIDRSIYVDNCCHVSTEGSAILARRIADAILVRSGQARADLAGIRAAVSPVVLDPREPAALRILATFADGTEADVTPAAQGTSYRSSAPGVLAVTSDGALRPFRAGSAIVEVTHRDQRIEVPVEVVAAEAAGSIRRGIGGAGGSVPKLSASGGAKDVRLAISGVRGGAEGALLLRRGGPPEWKAGAAGTLDSGDAVRVPLVAGGRPGAPGQGTVEHVLPNAADPALSGEILFVQAVFRDADAAGGWSATDVLVLVAR